MTTKNEIRVKVSKKAHKHKNKSQDTANKPEKNIQANNSPKSSMPSIFEALLLKAIPSPQQQKMKAQNTRPNPETTNREQRRSNVPKDDSANPRNYSPKEHSGAFGLSNDTSGRNRKYLRSSVLRRCQSNIIWGFHKCLSYIW